MKTIEDLKKPAFTTKESVNALGQRVQTKVPIIVKRPIKTVSSGTRFVHFLIDFIIITLILYILQYAGFFSRSTSYVWINCCSENGGSEFNYATLLVFFLYYLILESISARTFGKLITKFYVINEHAQKPAFVTIFLRTLCRLIPFERLSCINSHRGWHDKISSTYVVSKTEWESLKKELAGDDGYSDDSEILDA